MKMIDFAMLPHQILSVNWAANKPNAVDIAGAMKIVQGTARASGVTTEIDGMTKEEVAAKLA